MMKKVSLGIMNVGSAIAISYVGYAASFLLSIVVARMLGVEGKGVFTLFLVTAAAITAFSGLGIGHGQMYHVSKNPEKARHFMPNATIVSLVFSGGIAFVYFLTGTVLKWPIIQSLGIFNILLVVVLTPILSMLTFQRQFFLAIHQYQLSKIEFSVCQVVPLLLIAAIYPVWPITIGRIMVAYVISQVLCFAFFHILILKRRPEKSAPSFSFAKESMNFGIRQYLSDLVLYMTSRLDFFLVAWFCGDSGLGLYSVAVSLAEIACRVSSELGTILFPAFVSGQISNEKAVVILKITFISAVIIGLFLALAGNYLIVGLFGSRFAGSVLPLYSLLPGLVAWSSIYVTWNHVSASGHPGLGIPVFGAAATLDIILNLILLPKVGVVGASIAATCSYLLAAALFLGIFCRNTQISLREVILINSKDISRFYDAIQNISNYKSR